MKLSLGTLARIPFRSGTGVFEEEGVVHRVEVARTPLGLRRVADGDIDLVAVVHLWP